MWVSWCENKCFWQRFTCKRPLFWWKDASHIVHWWGFLPSWTCFMCLTRWDLVEKLELHIEQGNGFALSWTHRMCNLRFSSLGCEIFFFSSCSLKTREKYISFAQFVCALSETHYDWRKKEPVTMKANFIHFWYVESEFIIKNKFHNWTC